MLLRRGMFEKDEGKEVGFKVQKIELNAEKGFKNKEFLRNYPVGTKTSFRRLKDVLRDV